MAVVGVPPVTPFRGEEALLDLLQAVSRRFVAMTATALFQLEGRSGLRVGLPEYRVLVLLATQEAQRPSELADELEVTRPAIAQILGRLVTSGMVSRRPDAADHRSSILSLTPKGARVVRSVLSARERRLRPALATLTGKDRRTLAAALSRLDAALTDGEGR